jgi:hypothetical protein
VRTSGETNKRVARTPREDGLSSWLSERWVALAALSWLTSGALYLTLPPSPDQFQSEYLGWRLIEGDIPYRDFIDMNWPGVMGLHGLASWIFGVSLWSWRALDFSLFAVSAFFLADLVRLAASREAGKLSLILCPLVYAGAGYWFSGQHDMTAAQFLVAALWFHVRGYKRGAWPFQLGTGFFLGVAMLSKPTVGVMGLLLPLQALSLGTPFRRVLGHTSAAGASALAVVLAAFGGILARGASLQDVIDAVYTYNLATQFLGAKPLGDWIFFLCEVHARFWPALTFGSLPAIVWIVRRAPASFATTALPVLWMTGVLSFFIQRRGFSYHLAPCLLALTGTLAISLILVARAWMCAGGTASKRRIAIAFVVLSLLGIGTKLVTSYESLAAAFLAGDYGRHLSRFSGGDDLTVSDTVALARRLETRTPTGCLLVVGNASSVNYLSRRREPTRFYLFRVIPVITRVDPPLPLAKRWQELWEQDLRAADCPFAVVAEWVRKEWLPAPSRSAHALLRLLENYDDAGRLGADGGITLYERRSRAGGLP